jgi:hypothetical protein
MLLIPLIHPSAQTYSITYTTSISIFSVLCSSCYLCHYFHKLPKSDHAPALGSEAYPSAPCSIQLSDWRLSPRHFLSRLVSKLLQRSPRIYRWSSESGGTCNFFFSRGSFPPQRLLACVDTHRLYVTKQPTWQIKHARAATNYF